jgi:predicted dehydrogenase
MVVRDTDSGIADSVPAARLHLIKENKMSLPRHRSYPSHRPARRVRYAVVGLGHIAQNSVLPAFQNATRNSELAALVSDDRAKIKRLGEEYNVDEAFSYDDFESGLHDAQIDAVYIAVPNDMHEEYTVRAARAGVHVLSEKPLAVTEQQCQRMIDECRRNRVKLMAAYRLHFEAANLEAVQLVTSGKLGEPRIFNSLFSFQVREGNIRVKRERGGGTLFDIGIYCINAARYLFQSEPTEVFASTVRGKDKRFREIEEGTCALLRFPGERMASFTCSFGATDEARYEVLGSKGLIRVSNAYEYDLPIEVEIVQGGQRKVHSHKKRDQFGPELIYFSDCILKNRDPEPGGEEGLIDVTIINALYESAKRGHPIKLGKLPRVRHPRPRQKISCPPARKQKLLHVEAPTRD